MKRTILAFILLFSTLDLFSQGQSFSLLVERPYAEMPTGVVADDDGNYIISSLVRDYSTMYNHSWLLKVSQDGQILNERKFSHKKNWIVDMVKETNNTFYAFNSIESDTSDKYDLWIIKLNDNLDTIFTRRQYTGLKEISSGQAFVNSRGNTILSGAICNDEYLRYLFLYEIDSTGSLVDSAYFRSVGPNGYAVAFDVIEKTDTSGYYIFAFGTTTSSYYSYQLITVDRNFNLVSSTEPPYQLCNRNSAKWISDTTYVLTGGKYVYPNNQIGIAITDTASNLLYTNYFGDNDTTQFNAYWKSLDFVSPDNIYLIGVYNFHIGSMFQMDPSWLLIYNLNDTLGLKWQKIIGGDAFYMDHTLLATPDGGCLVLGTRFNYNQNYDYDLFLIKLDENGNVTSTNDNPGIQVKEALLYPNPGTSTLYIQTVLKDAKLEMYDANGRLVVQQDINETTTVNTSALNTGMYFYRVMQNGVAKESGKWVKTPF